MRVEVQGAMDRLAGFLERRRWVVLGAWIALQLVSGVGTIAYTDESANVGGVAYMAHIGGFAAGFLMAFLLRGTSPPSNAA